MVVFLGANRAAKCPSKTPEWKLRALLLVERIFSIFVNPLRVERGWRGFFGFLVGIVLTSAYNVIR